MRRVLLYSSLLMIALAPMACRGATTPRPAQKTLPLAALPAFDGKALMDHITVLASDEYEGRAPGTRGEELSVAYLAAQLKAMGLKPGNTDGTYVQKVPLVGMTVKGHPAMTFRKGPRRQTLAWRDDYVAWTKRVTESVSVKDSDMVFVGYGVEAPEFTWDDYKGIDLKGKTMVVLIGDPPVPDPMNPRMLDEEVFGGRAMTYYGRWTYKYEMGAKKGAAAVLIVHETEPAAYPFSVVQGKVSEQFDLVPSDKNMGRAAVEGWITLDQAKKLFALAGQDFEQLKRAAVTRDFRPVPLGTTATVSLDNSLRMVGSSNVVGKLEGSDPVLKNEFVIYTAHWDHFGIGQPVNGDAIYNGALDNASGVGGILEVARAFTQVKPAPRRSILFLFVTAEEQGLLGSSYYTTNPIYPLVKTAGAVNLDCLNMWGRTKDMVVVGLGSSELDDSLQAAAAEQDRVLKPDPTPEKGSYYRSDHFSFARQGVPALNPGGGTDFVGKPADWGITRWEEYTRNDYHRPSDEVRPDWTTDGALQDLQLYLAVGYRVANADALPQWKAGSEFKARRDAQVTDVK
jgi:Zn-dependent M28 family amino/carboxypeptidase